MRWFRGKQAIPTETIAGLDEAREILLRVLDEDDAGLSLFELAKRVEVRMGRLVAESKKAAQCGQVQAASANKGLS